MAQAATKSTALWVLRRLRQAGHEAFLAGGCVRDMLLGVRSADYDIATNATPREVKRIFRHVLMVGAKFGVAMVIHKAQVVEVTTFRSDLSYRDGRRPEGVTYATPREDALRRDFTINGMFYDPPADRIIDYVGGRDDLAKRRLRTIGRPEQRFAEDYLRMIRAVRFAVRFDLTIDPKTGAAMRKHAPKIASISGERIFDELSKMLSLPSAARAMEVLHQHHLARPILPELFQQESFFQDGLTRLKALAKRKDLTLALAALLGSPGPEAIARIVRRWGGSKELRQGLCWLARHLNDWPRAADLPPANFKRLMADANFPRLRALWRAEEHRKTPRRTQSRRIDRRVAAIPTGQIAPGPFLTGVDLMALGLPEGQRLGRILRAVYDAQLNEEITTKREALKKARELM